MKLLHVIREVTRGGASLGLLNMCRHGPPGVSHEVLSLVPPEPAPLAAFQDAGVPVVGVRETVAAVERADVVQVEWWNTLETVRFLASALPPCRILLHSRAHFDAPMMCPSEALLRRVDAVTVSTPSSANNAEFRRLADRCGLPAAACIYSSAVVPEHRPRVPQPTGAIGYLGTIEDIKMHCRALPMIAEVLRRLPGVDFEFAGEGSLDDYRAQARALGVGERVKFVGFVAEPQRFLHGLDVLFYPLNPYTYATSEKAVQEAMLAGVVVAAYPHGGLRDLLTPACAIVEQSEASLVCATAAAMGDMGRLRSLGAAAQHRLSDWPVSRDWRQRAHGVWRQLAAQPKRLRSSLGALSNEQALRFSYAPAACPRPAELAAQRDWAAVAGFVLEHYCPTE